MRSVNVFDGEMDYDAEDPEGYRAGVMHVSKALGATGLAARAFLVPPGQSVCPYHYEYEEEWLLVLDGSIVVRTPEGEQELGRGEIVAFPPGRDGAHKTTNRGTEPARVLLFSSAREPAVTVYPDSDKIGVWPGEDADHVILRRSDGAAGYYDGEP